MEEFNELLKKHNFDINERGKIDAFIEAIKAYDALQLKIRNCDNEPSSGELLYASIISNKRKCRAEIWPDKPI